VLNLTAMVLLQFDFVNPFVAPLEQMLAWLAEFLTPIVAPVSAFISPYAAALILVAVLVKVLTYPLTAAQTKSMRAMQSLQPELAALQQKHKGDREKLAQAQMELYKEKGVNPFGGCLPLIITLVVLFSLYGAITGLTEEMAGQNFLWIQDISVCEPNPMCGSVMAIPILVVIMIVSQMLYQKYLTPPTTDPNAQTMATVMKFMPLLFGYIFLTLPAGLVLYYLVFNVVSIVQQVFLNRQLGQNTMMLAVPVAEGAGVSPAPAAEPLAPEEETSHERGDGRRRRRKKGA
jgi:YidC/Oxa1 family membrane protein insertase